MSQPLESFHDTWLPLYQERPALTNTALCSLLLPLFLSYYVMATLVQLPGTKLIRAAILPVVLWFAVRAGMTLDFSQKREEYAHSNHSFTLVMGTLALRCTAWTLADKPYIRWSSGTDNAVPKDTLCSNNLRSVLWNACDLCCNFRGLGWNWSQGVRLPRSVVETNSKLAFVCLSLGRFILYVTMWDVADVLLRSIAPPGPGAWSIFDPSLPPIQRYLRSIMIAWLAGFLVYFSTETIYQVQAIIFTILFRQQPQQWPPVFDQPWFATSVSRFWGRGWHQLYRESFIAVGIRPLQAILGKYSILGAFFLSGVLHDVGVRGMDHGGNSASVIGFFFMQGIGVVLEKLWTRFTRRRVDGVLGCLWVWVWLTIWGVFLVDVWAKTAFIARSDAMDGVYTPLEILTSALQWIRSL